MTLSSSLLGGCQYEICCLTFYRITLVQRARAIKEKQAIVLDNVRTFNRTYEQGFRDKMRLDDARLDVLI